MTETLSRRTYLTIKAMEAAGPEEGMVGILVAMEAVASTAIEHPEWDMDEHRTWGEWERA